MGSCGPGRPWRDLPERYGSWKTVYRRLRRWQQAGIWERILIELQREAAEIDQTDGSLTMIDSSNIRAHQHAAGARKKGGVAGECLGRSRGGFGSKLHLTTERHGKPIATQLSARKRHESTQAAPLLAETLNRMWQDAVAGDKAYSTIDFRNWLTAHEIAPVIRYRDNESGPKTYDRNAYRERPIAERTINRLKRSRRTAARFSSRAAGAGCRVACAGPRWTNHRLGVSGNQWAPACKRRRNWSARSEGSSSGRRNNHP